MVDTRGPGHSVPALGCPEVARLSTTAWATRTGDRARRETLLTAVRSCRQRIVADGSEVAAYNAVEAAADLVDLRHALGAPRWNVTSYGVGSRLALELLRQDATGFRTLVLDSPDVPGTDFRVVAGAATEDAALHVLAACAADRQSAPDTPPPTDSSAVRWPRSNGVHCTCEWTIAGSPCRSSSTPYDGRAG